VIRPDPDAFDPVTDPVTECLCFEMRDYFDDSVLLVNAFCPKSVVCAAHSNQ